MITGIIEGSTGFLETSSGIKYAFATDVKDILKILPGYVRYLTTRGEERTLNFLQSSGCITILGYY